MLTYFTAFIFYTLAMVGVLLVGFVIYKKTMLNTQSNTKGMIKILDSIAIGPKKTLMVVKIKNEKFLIASGAEHTTFLSKLNFDENQPTQKANKEAKNHTEEILNTIIPQMNAKKEELTPQEWQDLRMEKINKQFKDLYSQNPIEKQELSPVEKLNLYQQKHENTSRREMIQSLLKDLNETATTSAGSKF